LKFCYNYNNLYSEKETVLEKMQRIFTKTHLFILHERNIPMIEDITLRAFDEIVNPILLCELNGKTIYKNSEAKLSLKKPALGGKIQTYLSRDFRYLLENGATPDDCPTFIELESDGDLFCSFVDTVYYERRPALLFVFSHLFLYEVSVPLFREHPHELRESISGEKLAHLATNIYTSDLVVEASRKKSHHKRMTQIFYKLVNTLLTELSYGKDSVVYPLAYTVSILSYACNKVLSHLGLDIVFDIRYENADSTFVDFKTLTLLLTNFILMAAEITDSHIIYASVEKDSDGSVIFRFPLQVNKQAATIPLGGIGSFTELLPGRSVDLFFFNEICKSSNYHFDFTLNPKEKENLRMRLHTPVCNRLVLHEVDPFRYEDAIRMIDRLAERLLSEIEDM